MDNASNKVSVVIPTLGRTSLHAAVQSALDQTAPPLEVLIGADTTETLNLPDDERISVVRCGPRGGGNTARMAAIRQAKGDFVALLDDDDQWERHKLAEQLHLVKQLELSLDHPWIVSSRIFDTDRVIRPEKIVTLDDNPLEYLFMKQSARRGVGKAHTSTLLFPKWMADKVEFDPAVKFYQDPTWFIQLLKEFPDTRFAQCSSPLVRCQKTPGSVFNSVSWRESAKWIEESMSHLPARWRGDFALTNMLQRALTSDAKLDASRSFLMSFKIGRPGLPAIVYGFAKLGLHALSLRRK